MLEIVIPTYNRSIYLERTLVNLSYSLLDKSVSVIVADNSTNSDTSKMLERVSSRLTFPLRYHRFRTHETSVGKSILRSVLLGSSKYMWVLGDDDLIMPGSVTYLLSILKSEENAGLVFINYLTGKFRTDKIEDIKSVFDFQESRRYTNSDLLEFLPEISFISSCIFNREEFLRQNTIDFNQCFGYEFLAPLLLCSTNMSFTYIQYPLVLQRRLPARSWDDLYPLYYFVGLPNVRRVVKKSLDLEDAAQSLFSYMSLKPVCILAASAKSRRVCMSRIKNELRLLDYVILYLIVKIIPAVLAKYILGRV